MQSFSSLGSHTNEKMREGEEYPLLGLSRALNTPGFIRLRQARLSETCESMGAKITGHFLDSVKLKLKKFFR